MPLPEQRKRRPAGPPPPKRHDMFQPNPKNTTNMRKIAVSTWAHEGYKRAIWRAGGYPFVVTEHTLLSELDKCDGLLIPGGRDVCPAFYGEQIHTKTQDPDLNRDSLEMALIKRAVAKDMPVLGVCRGHQLLNVALGGSLHQHIEVHEGVRHSIDIKPGSKLGFIEGDGRLIVNSYHHQAIKELGSGLEAIAWDPADGTIEAVEDPSKVFVVGVQFHPEMSLTPRFDREMKRLMYRFTHARKS